LKEGKREACLIGIYLSFGGEEDDFCVSRMYRIGRWGSSLGGLNNL
jgi:hypothetical protein